MLDFNKIKVIAIDVDGTLTDGMYTVSDDGHVSKSFYTKDFWAIEQALKNGIRVVIITQSQDKVIYRRLNNIAECSAFWSQCMKDNALILVTAADNKKMYLEYLGTKFGFDFSQLAYIGDACNDIESMKESHFSACPKDAGVEVDIYANYRSMKNGGHGAVFDIINFILERRKGADNDNS